MPKSALFSILRPVAAAITVFLLACSPALDWREVRSGDGSFTALFPGKPATQTRQIQLAGAPVTMTMTAADVDGVTYAIASARVSAPAAVQPSLDAMKAALVGNIGGTVRKEATAPASPGAAPAIDVEAVGKPDPRSRNADKQPIMLYARFAAKDLRVFQAVVLGPEKAVTRDAVDTFLTSFKPN